ELSASQADEVGLRLASDAFRVEVPTVDIEADDYRDFAHVVVDEAQDLTPMQWRAVARRGAVASWTVVGDLAQRRQPGEPGGWATVARLIGRRQIEIHELSVNYRTPTEVAAIGEEILRAIGRAGTTPMQAVRSSGHRP